MADRIPVAIGQRRRDPDPRQNGRVVTIVELDVEPVYWSGQLLPAVRAEGPTGRRSRIRTDRIERWEVVEPASFSVRMVSVEAEGDPKLVAAVLRGLTGGDRG